jgi:acyl-CoA thioesterase FadM
MTHQFTAHFRIRQYELDAHSNLPNSTLARLFQEAATRASADAGFGVDWYSTHTSAWLVHELTLVRSQPIRYGDELAITTWVSDFQRVRSHREYLARNVKTDVVVARGRAYWVQINPASMMPARVPPEIVTRFDPNGVSALTRATPRVYPPLHLAVDEFRATRRVQRYEADGMQHVNNAMYIDWLEEALTDAIARPATASSIRFARSESTQGARQLCVYRHDIEYARSAVPGDDVTIRVQLVGAGQSASLWDLEIRRGVELLIHDRLTAIGVGANGKPARWNERGQV